MIQILTQSPTASVPVVVTGRRRSYTWTGAVMRVTNVLEWAPVEVLDTMRWPLRAAQEQRERSRVSVSLLLGVCLCARPALAARRCAHASERCTHWN